MEKYYCHLEKTSKYNRLSVRSEYVLSNALEDE